MHGERSRGAAAAIVGGLLLTTGLGVAAEDGGAGGGNIDAKSFKCIAKLTAVRHFYVDNLRRDFAATVAAADAERAMTSSTLSPVPKGDDRW
jgi:hypothetical protein